MLDRFGSADQKDLSREAHPTVGRVLTKSFERLQASPPSTAPWKARCPSHEASQTSRIARSKILPLGPALRSRIATNVRREQRRRPQEERSVTFLDRQSGVRPEHPAQAADVETDGPTSTDALDVPI